MPVRNERVAVAHIFADAVNDDSSRERDFDFWICLEKFTDSRKRAGQVLFVAVQISEDVAGRAAVAAVDGVIHATVLLDEGLDPWIMRQPVLRAVVGTGILHDMLELDALLVGHGRDAQLEPCGIAEAGRDDGKCHNLIQVHRSNRRRFNIDLTVEIA